MTSSAHETSQENFPFSTLTQGIRNHFANQFADTSKIFGQNNVIRSGFVFVSMVKFFLLVNKSFFRKAIFVRIYNFLIFVFLNVQFIFQKKLKQSIP